MGVTYILANTAKRQYFDPGHFGEDTKRNGILSGQSGHALAQLLLPGADLDFHLEPWFGDSLTLVGDYGEPSCIEILTPFRDNPEQHAYEIVTTKFSDISLNLLALVCKAAGILDWYIDRAERSETQLIALAHCAFFLPAKHIEFGLAQRFGFEWRARYDGALKRQTWYYPLPMKSG